MKRRKSSGNLALRLAAALACALSIGTAAGAPAADGGQRPGTWWNWWSWVNELFGTSFGEIRYGSAANPVVGSDNLVHQLRTISGVHAIELRGPIDIVLRQGRMERATLHTDDNIAPLIRTDVHDGVLQVAVQPGTSFRTKHAIGMTVELPRLDGLRILGPGNFTCAGFAADLLQVTMGGSGSVRFDDLHAAALAVLIQGSGDVHLSGSVPKQGYVIEGSGSVDAEELAGKELAVRIVGSGGAKLWATGTLAVRIDGTGDVTYRGQPSLTQSLNGTGRLRHE